MKAIAQNRRARYDYEILDTIEAGLVLTGQEVKACRAGQANLKGAYVSLHSGNVVLKKASIAPYRYASKLDDYDPQRDRTLLLKKTQILKLTTHLNEKGVSVIPLEITAGKHLKVKLGVGRGVKRHDKRSKIKEKDIKRRLKQGKEI